MSYNELGRNRIQILDCTLRDGGYIFDWKIGEGNIKNIVHALSEAEIDYIELGYLRDGAGSSFGCTSCADINVFNSYVVNEKRKKSCFLVMIDLNQFRLSHLKEASQNLIDGIRLTYKKNEIKVAVSVAKEIIDKGYKLFLQPVSITDYSVSEFIEMIQTVEQLSAYSLSIVDTYGLLNPLQLETYFRIADEYLRNISCIGFHGHNSQQLVHANIWNILNQNFKHPVIVDSTLMGIGKDSGNACTELVAKFANEIEDMYGVEYLADVIDSTVMPLKGKRECGYNFTGFLSSLCFCRTEYVKFIQSYNCLKLPEKIEILKSIDKDKKTTDFHKLHIVELLDKYINRNTEEKL